MTEYICPQCNKSLQSKRSLDRHIASVHGGQGGQGGEGGQVFEIETTTLPGEDQTYHCVGCGYEGLTKGQTPCPRCGETLVWDGVS